MLTDIEAQIIADALLLRAVEQARRDCGPLWFAGDEFVVLSEAHKRVELGDLERRYDRGRADIQYRATDQAIRAQELHAATVSTAA